MPGNWQDIAVPLSGGLDSRTDPKAVDPPKLLELLNGEFSGNRNVRKRPGRQQLGEKTHETTPVRITSAKAIGKRGNEPVLFDGDKVYSYAQNMDRWVPRGAASSVKVTHEVIADLSAKQTIADYDSTDGIGVFAWEDSRGGIYGVAIDETTGAELATAQLNSSGQSPRVVALGGLLHVVFVDGTSIKVSTISSAQPATTIGATPTSLVTDVHASDKFWDIQKQSTNRAAFAYVETGQDINVAYMDADGTLSGTPPLFTINTTPFNGLSVHVEPQTLDVIITYGTSLSGTQVAVYSEDFTQLVAPTQVYTVSGARHTMAFRTEFVSGTTWRADIFVEFLGSTNTVNGVVQRTLDRDGTVGTLHVLHRHSSLGSKAWQHGGRQFVTMLHEAEEGLQNTYFVIDETGKIVAKLLNNTAGDTPARAHLPQVVDRGNGKYAFAAIYRRQLESENNDVFTAEGIKKITIDHEADGKFHGIEAGAARYHGGGYLAAYDGARVTEAGFHLFPEGVEVDGLTTGGGSGDINPTNGTPTLSYRVYLGWRNAKGEVEISGTAKTYTATLTASHDAATITIPTISQTDKEDTFFLVFRAQENAAAGDPFYKVTSDDPSVTTGSNRWVANDWASADTVSLTDEMGDTVLATKELDYLNTGEQQNKAPPAADIIAEGKDRIFLAGAEDPNAVHYSKPLRDGRVAEFNPANVMLAPNDGGPITALGFVNDLLVIFKKRQIYAVAGEGPNLFGQGFFSNPELINTDVGCIDQRSVVSTPDGLVFLSEKGWKILTKGLQVMYLGADVEAYNDQSFSGAVLVSSSNQVRCIASSGSTLVYDYFVRAWARWSQPVGIGAVVIDGVMYHATSDGKVFKEVEDFFKDGAAEYRLRIQTAWLRPRGLQGFWRVRSPVVIGEFKTTHKLAVKVGYNYQTPVDEGIFDPSTALEQDAYGNLVYGVETPYGGDGDRIYQFEILNRQQKCQAISFWFEDMPGNDPGESYELSEIALQVAIKRGHWKLPASKGVTVGNLTGS